jgi:hypothetical protein
MPAKLPEDRVGDSTRCLRDVQIGETVYSWEAAMCIDEERSCFLGPGSYVFSDDADGFSTVRITRTEEGWDVQVLSKEAKWEPRPVRHDYYPVRTLTIAE